jgi:hypothetical protein
MRVRLAILALIIAIVGAAVVWRLLLVDSGHDGPQPEILSFTGNVAVFGHDASAAFTWETRNVERVSLTSGCIEDGVFYGGGWHSQDDLPPNGSAGFSPKIDNYAAQLCVVDPVGDPPVCAVINPFGTEGGGCMPIREEGSEGKLIAAIFRSRFGVKTCPARVSRFSFKLREQLRERAIEQFCAAHRVQKFSGQPFQLIQVLVRDFIQIH